MSWKLSRTVLGGWTNSNVGPYSANGWGKRSSHTVLKFGNAELFAFAGIWDRWKDPSGQWVKSCSILTTTPNAVMSLVHDRMPVILRPNDYDLWLDPGMTKVEAVSDLLKPYALTMRSFPVSSRVNHVVIDDAACSTPVQLDKVQTQTTLF